MNDKHAEALSALERQFHDLIRAKVGALIEKHNLQLPDLSEIAGSPESKGQHFPIPGLYGGFNYWLEGQGDQTSLIVLIFSRIVGGSEQFYEITVGGCRLIAGEELRLREKFWTEKGSPVLSAADRVGLETEARMRESLHAAMAAQFGPIPGRSKAKRQTGGV